MKKPLCYGGDGAFRVAAVGAGHPGGIMNISPEAERDYAAIARIVAAAFGKEDEARLVERVRASPNYVPELALVAEIDVNVVGHAMLSYMAIETAEGERLRVLALAPVSVAPEDQNTGIGSALVREELVRADASGEPIVIVLGHPAYYPRFGFEPARRHGIEPPWPELPDGVFMVRPLSSYDARYRGRAVYPPAFDER